ncbi:MAG: hypothetical protein OXH09_14165 [Gammaproteobacteria bacterium]|nr:hypothetical protein [Gammaproteobacteria bacterium]
MNKLFRGAVAFAMLLFASFAVAQLNHGFDEEAIWYSQDFCENGDEEPSGGFMVDAISDLPEAAESYQRDYRDECINVVTYYGDVEDYMGVMDYNGADVIYHNCYEDEIPQFAMCFGTLAELFVVRPGIRDDPPPTLPGAPRCPKWDQVFDAASGACVTRPFDADAKALAGRVKNCGAASVVSYLDHSLVSVGYGLPRDVNHYGNAECRPKGNKPPTSVAVRLHRASLEKSSDGSESSVWHWAALAAIHEFVHTGDFIGYDSCAPWYTLAGVRDIKRAGYTVRDINKEGFEKWTVERSDDEYEAAFGVLSPYDPFHNATADNKPLPCLFD